MTNQKPSLLPHTAKYSQVNHGWWCTECTTELFEIDKRSDYTGEWLAAMTAWSQIAGLFVAEFLFTLGTGIVGLFMAFAWIIICLHDGVISDTHEYEKRLKEHDGLNRKERDYLSSSYDELLAERQVLVKSIDQIKARIGKIPGTKDELPGWSPQGHIPDAREDQEELFEHQARLRYVEHALHDCEKELRCAQIA